MTFRSVYLAPFRVDVDIREGTPRVLPAVVAARTIAAALAAGGAPEPAAVGLILADDRELARLNAAHLDHHGATDVLSFPLLPPAAYPPHPGRLATPAGRPVDPAFLLPPGTRLHLGDVVISVERAIAQAEGGRGGQTGDARWRATDELRLLLIHGALHLCGWDHAEPVEAAAMRALEQTLLGIAVTESRGRSTGRGRGDDGPGPSVGRAAVV